MDNIDGIFLKITDALTSPAGAKLSRKFPGSVRFVVSAEDGSTKELEINMKSKPVSVSSSPSTSKVDLVVKTDESTFVSLFNGTVKPQTAFLKKLIKIKGKVSLAMKLQNVVKGVRMYGARSKL